jgi:hypothetical protein
LLCGLLFGESQKEVGNCEELNFEMYFVRAEQTRIRIVCRGDSSHAGRIGGFDAGFHHFNGWELVGCAHLDFGDAMDGGDDQPA